MKKSGFTLIELLVVISIIGILAALVMVNFNAARARARDVQRKSDLDQMKKALRLYYNDNNEYPDPMPAGWGSPFESGGIIYMKLLPHDPLYDPGTGTPEYSYSRIDENDFCLKATLENTADGDIAKSQSRCSGCGDGDNYVVCAD